MARRQKFLAAEFSKRFEKSYGGLTVAQQNGVDKAVIALLKRKPSPGMRVKPIQPDKFYDEARIRLRSARAPNRKRHVVGGGCRAGMTTLIGTGGR